jgi:cytochrome c oxidase subunit 3/cytochrome o ubiquinol oxidase subunit 3
MESRDMSAAAASPATPTTRELLLIPPAIVSERTLSPGEWGLVSFLVSEVALFGTMIVVYVFYLGKDQGGPTPAVALSLSVVLCTTAWLLASSGTVNVAKRALHGGAQGWFVLWWLATIVLGVLFLGGTAYEWYGLIVDHGLTMSRNLFGTTYYTLVVLHALHVTGGVTIMLIVLGLALRRRVTTANQATVGLMSW